MRVYVDSKAGAVGIVRDVFTSKGKLSRVEFLRPDGKWQKLTGSPLRTGEAGNYEWIPVSLRAVNAK